MDPKFIKENAPLIRENEINRNGSPDLVDTIVLEYQRIVKLDFIISQLKRGRNLSGPLMKGQVSETSNQLEYTDQVWIKFLDDLSEKSTSERALTALSQLNRKGLISLLKQIKLELIKSENEIKGLRQSSLTKSQELGNIIPLNVHQFSKDKAYTATKEIPYILGPNSPLLGPVKKEPNVKFEMKWITNKDHSEQVLYVSETPHHLYELENLGEELKGHCQLTKDLKLVDYDESIKVAGNRGYSFLDLGVKLNRALMNYAVDFLSEHDYSLVETPHMMTAGSLSGVTQLTDFQESLYPVGRQETDPKLIDENKFLIATSEQPLTAFYRDKVLRSSFFPIRRGGISHCYRKEAGSHGVDTRGIFRVHQFQKIEQFAITNPENSWDEMARMIKISAEFYDTLGLKYRIIKVASNDINTSASMKYDLEGYFPNSKKYRELVSCTNCTDYIARKIHCRTDQQRIPHFLNSTLCANTRVICCLLETYQDPKNNLVNLPDVLIPYMNGIVQLKDTGLKDSN